MPDVNNTTCRSCGGSGQVAEQHWEHRDPVVSTCEVCEGTGNAPKLEHWHSGPLGADQFCAACDGEAA